MAIRSAIDSALLALLSDRDQVLPSLDEGAWEGLVRAAVRHGVAPLVHARLRDASDASSVPTTVRHALKTCHLRTGLENLRLLTRVADLLRELHDAGIEAIVLKGAYLAQAVYGEPALRSMGDADVLIRRADLVRAAALMRAGGWLDKVPGATTPEHGHQLPTLALGGAQVELHWSIEDDDSPFAIDGDGLWRRAVRTEIGGAPALALSQEDLLLHLALHAAYGHGWLQFEGGLRPLADIVACLRQFGAHLDWNVMVDRARAWGVHRSLWVTLVLVRDLLHVDAPPQALRRLAPVQPDRALTDTATALVLGNHYRDLVARLPTLGRTWLIKRRHRLPRAVQWSAYLFPTAESLASAYPSLRRAPLRPLRYAMHGADLLADVARLSFDGRTRSLVRLERGRTQLLRWLESP